MYSLIQAQFDAASQQTRQSDLIRNSEDYDDEDEQDDARPAKRRKLSGDIPDGDVSEPRQENSAVEDEPTLPEPTNSAAQLVVETTFETPRSKVTVYHTSPLSSPPPDEFIIPPSAFRSRTQKCLAGASLPMSSSPLSSPPPVLFDPFMPSSPPGTGSSRRSSTTPSEVDDSFPSSNPFTSSQTSNSGKTSLPNMKGKDLFDANIWSDPIRTSVFYTFATSLRQKIKSAEPTTSHRFISHLRDRGKLVRCYTQNIDQIEEKVGLSTRLQDGPGSRGRFSRRSTANMSQLNKMVEEANTDFGGMPSSENSSQSESQPESDNQSQTAAVLNGNSMAPADGETPVSNVLQTAQKSRKRDSNRSGVECVFLHGSLELLRCFLCGRVCSWEDDDRETETLSGQQPECPHCVGATMAREERGKRALGVGKLRPDIVLYGEEHPNSHLISPIITHDLSLNPDVLLILGTSLRVHGLKVMVREFAKAVHGKGGKVVFVNFTKPPESIWGDVIDYWVQWDCDAWVTDLQARIPKLWQKPEPPRARKKRESSGTSEEGAKDEKKKPPAANPAALRDTKITGAYWTGKVLDELHRITGEPSSAEPAPARRASVSAMMTQNEITPLAAAASPLTPVKATKPRRKRPRRSAPGALEKTERRSSTLNPNHGRPLLKVDVPTTTASLAPLTIAPFVAEEKGTHAATSPAPVKFEPSAISSILSSVKDNPRIRKRKRIDGEEVVVPTAGRRRGGGSTQKLKKNELRLPPLRQVMADQSVQFHGKLQPLEPKSPPFGPLVSLSPNLRSAKTFQRNNAFYMDDSLVRLLHIAPCWHPGEQENKKSVAAPRGAHEEANAAFALAGLRAGSPAVVKPVARRSPVVTRSVLCPPAQGNLESWGASWNCHR